MWWFSTVRTALADFTGTAFGNRSDNITNVSPAFPARVQSASRALTHAFVMPAGLGRNETLKVLAAYYPEYLEAMGSHPGRAVRSVNPHLAHPAP